MGMTNMMRRFLLTTAATVALAASAQAQQLGTVFYIDMENHNLTQPGSVTSPQQLLGNPAAPFLNSLMTPGNPNAAQASWASNLTNVAPGIHPSEPTLPIHRKHTIRLVRKRDVILRPPLLDHLPPACAATAGWQLVARSPWPFDGSAMR